MIQISNLTKDYGARKGVFNLQLSVNKGEIFGFIGPNGAGKTTTIRHLLGFIKPEHGSCTINGLDCWKHSALIMQNIGYLPGEIAFFEGMKGLEFLEFKAKLHGMQNLHRAHDLLERLELQPNVRIKRMSKGMKQKLAIVAACMHSPEILILDEPTSGLDPLMQKVFNDIIFEEKAKGTTILMSSHSFEEIEKTCGRVGLIKQGEMVAIEEMQHIKHLQKQKYILKFSNIEECKKFVSNEQFQIISQEENSLKIAVSQNLPHVLARVSTYQIIEIQSELGSLEDLFMPYYSH